MRLQLGGSAKPGRPPWLLALALLAGCATTAPAKVHVGDDLSFSLRDLEGGSVSPEALSGQVLLVDLWATWCKPCKESFPFYASLYEQHRGDGFRVLAISVDEREEDVRAYLEENPVPFLVLRDPEGTIAEKIGVEALPTMMILGRDGRVAFVHSGFQLGDEGPITAAVKEALTASVAPGDAPKQ